jgi:flotillin
VVEKRKQIEVQEQEVMRMERELEATIRKPAEAEQFRIQTLASAKKFQLEVEAEGQMSATRNMGVGEADANKARGLAQADIIKAQGLNQAEVIQAQGLAEATATSKKAAAWEQYTQAAILQQILDKLPALATAIAQPLSQTDKIVVISTGADGGAGTSKITRDVADSMSQIPAVIEALTGISLIDLLKNLPAVKEAVNNKPEKEP